MLNSTEHEIYPAHKCKKPTMLRLHPANTQQGVQRRLVLVVNFFRNFEIIIFCFVVTVSDLVHDV